MLIQPPPPTNRHRYILPRITRSWCVSSSTIVVCLAVHSSSTAGTRYLFCSLVKVDWPGKANFKNLAKSSILLKLFPEKRIDAESIKSPAWRPLFRTGWEHHFSASWELQQIWKRNMFLIYHCKNKESLIWTLYNKILNISTKMPLDITIILPISNKQLIQHDEH